MNFEPCIRYFDELGLAKVYIRLSHKRKIGYIKTKFVANKSQVDGTRVKDLKLLALIIPQIQEWSMMINATSLDDVNQIMNYLSIVGDISFTEFSKGYIRNESKKGRDKSMGNYTTALKSLQDFLKKDDILFTDITSNIINKWIEKLSDTKRAKQMYPNAVKKLFKEGQLEYNDYDNGITRIKHEPFKKVKIPPAEQSNKKGLTVAQIKAIFDFDTSICPGEVRATIGQDLAKLVFYLAGINTVDLYFMKRENLTDWKLTYQRRKTSKRSDGAHMEITVPKEIRPLFEKYRGDERLFNFHKRYANADIFSSNINKGLRSINPKLTTYTFRHSWATIARNDCGVLMEDVGFCLNHVSAHKVTDGYVVKDYSKVDVINQMVIKKVSELHNPDTFEQHQI